MYMTKRKLLQRCLMVPPLLVGVILIAVLFRPKAEVALTSAPFEVFQGIPYCVREGTLYRYEDIGWVHAGYTETIGQLISGDALCAVDVDGNVACERDYTVMPDKMGLTGAYYWEMARQLIVLNQTIPFVEISGDFEHGARALLEDGSILLPIEDHYEQYTMEEPPIALSGDFILTEKGNVYQLSCELGIENRAPDLRCIYDGEDITAINSLPGTGQCLGITKKGGVISWNETGIVKFDIPFVSSWTDVVMVKQGFHFALALTKAGEVLYADSDAENTERIGRELDKWRDIANISISGMTVYGLQSDGSCLSMEIKF